MRGDLLKQAQLGFYLAWLPMTALLLVLLAVRGGRSVAEAALISVPLCAVYALVTRSSLYMCRVMPLERGSFSRLSVSHGLAALLASAAWVLLALGLERVLSLSPPLTMETELSLVFGIGTVYYLLAVVYHYLVLAVVASREAAQAALEARTLAREAELRALRAQLNPHFLFNALHSISALTAVDPAKAREMTLALSEFLRSSLRLGDKPTVTLREELALARSYLQVESIRFSDRLRYAEEVEEACLEVRLPPLLLQPLVENAVKHGVAHLTEEARISLRARVDEGRLRLTVENDRALDAPPSRGAGRGLGIARERLRAHFGPRAWLEATALPPAPEGDPEVGGYRVELTVPVMAE